MHNYHYTADDRITVAQGDLAFNRFCEAMIYTYVMQKGLLGVRSPLDV